MKGVDPDCVQFFRVDPSLLRDSTSVQKWLIYSKGVELQIVKESTLDELESTPAKKKNQAKGETSKNEEVTCFECRKPGHIRPECPELKKKKTYSKGNGKTSKKKALAAWSDEDTSTEEESEEEIANLCLIAKSDHEKDSV
ncbi:hypothetical protein Taro_036419 [Colocasia esculenta]|uniref:CCHC-type domain-containing protein n=1 Tax=Colocasia esculenta TaxID=4460 RepID=A0A843VXF8_COLES|nr:hypothetical protein [Colocasia esculenta]